MNVGPKPPCLSPPHIKGAILCYSPERASLLPIQLQSTSPSPLLGRSATLRPHLSPATLHSPTPRVDFDPASALSKVFFGSPAPYRPRSLTNDLLLTPPAPAALQPLLFAPPSWLTPFLHQLQTELSQQHSLHHTHPHFRALSLSTLSKKLYRPDLTARLLRISHCSSRC
jgi:hypothetical protein